MGMTHAPDVWHPDETGLAQYVSGRPTVAAAASIESHLLGCGSCRAEIRAMAPLAIVHDGRDRLRVAMQVGTRPLLVRLAERLGLSDATATLITESRAMSDAWLLSLALVLGFAALSETFSGWLGDALFLLVAPLVPVIGVALAYQNTDPTLERIARSAPYSSLRLVLLRTISVLVTSVPMCLVAAFVVAGAGGLVAWLLPALAFTALLLALATRVAVELAAAAVSLGWAFVIGTLALHRDPTAAVTASLQPTYLLVAVLAAAFIAGQTRRGFTPGGIA
jgi:hypothetical protein